MKIPSPVTKSSVLATPVVRAAEWMRAGYPAVPPCGHIALVALCWDRPNRDEE